MPTAVQVPSRKLLRKPSFRACAILIAAVSGLAGCFNEQPSSERSSLNAQQSGDEMRTAWYPDQPGLSPSVVSGTSFGQLYSTQLVGSVYAQPLLAGNTLLVATEGNHVYGLNPASGAISWDKFLGTPFNPQDIGCGDLTPQIGVTGAPVVDAATNTAYVVSKTYNSQGGAAWYAHALDVSTGVERANFPVLIQGKAANNALLTFSAPTAHQRTGLLLMDGVIYAGFGSHCDIGPWGGWVVGISTAGAITTLWNNNSNSTTDGSGIWHSGGGLVSDGPGQILFATGNGNSPTGPLPGKSGSPRLGEALVRLTVQADGKLKNTDFFAPYDAPALDGWDADFGSGGPVGLPDAYFGTAAYPHLMVTAGKTGYVYLINRDNMGGIGNGANGGDAVIKRTGSVGGVWSKPAVYPGQGGFIYYVSGSGGMSAAGGSGSLKILSYGLDGNGVPSLNLIATAQDTFPFGSGAPVVTSDGTLAGSALVWAIWYSDGGGQLRAYDAVPVNGQPVLRFSSPLGQTAKFAPPGVGGGRVFVGTRDGRVLGFGNSTVPQLTGSGVDFGPVTPGSSQAGTLTVTASNSVTVTGITSSRADYQVGTLTPGLPRALQAGQSLAVPITFTPGGLGMIAGTITVATSGGSFPFSVIGTGRTVAAQLVSTPPMISMGGTGVGTTLVGNVTFSNTGGSPLTINAVTLPGAPFSTQGAPAVGSSLASGQSVTLTITFAPTALGSFVSAVALDTSAGVRSVPITAVASPSGHLTISTLNIPYGVVGTGTTRSAQFTLTNDGGATITILKSKPPSLGAFVAQTSVPEGTSLVAGATLTETVVFVPGQAGPATDGWTFTANDATGVQTVTFSGVSGADITAAGTPVALVPNPSGGGNHNLAVIADGVFPPVGSGNDALQFDTYNGIARTEDWIGYTFPSPRVFGELVFQEGKQYGDGGWFIGVSLKVQVRQNGAWVTVPGMVVRPSYLGANGVNFETYNFAFPPVTGDGIRIAGIPGGASQFVSVGELRALGAAAVAGPNHAPVANAGAAQTVVAAAAVTLDGSGSTDSDADLLTYAWTQTGGPTVALTGALTAKPTFTAPSVTSTTALTFSLIVKDAALFSTPATVTVTVTPAGTPPPAGTAVDLTATGTAVARITNPSGGGNHSLAVISDGVFPAVGSNVDAQQYDTYTGVARTDDWVGYTFAAPQSFSKLVFQEGKQFGDGGWFSSLKVQVRQNGVWTDVAGAVINPLYPGANGVTFETFTFTFNPTTGDGLRIYGTLTGATTFISVGELRAFGSTTTTPGPNLAPVASAGPAQSVASAAAVTLDGTGSNDPNGDALTFGWTQTAGPAVTLTGATTAHPTFTAPTVAVSTALTFTLVVQDASLPSAPATVTITVAPPPAPPPTGTVVDLTASGTVVALVTNPSGGGNRSLTVISDGVFPPVGSNVDAQQYDTYTGQNRTEDWVGYTFAQQQTFSKLVFQEGKQFGDGGWFTSLKVQVRQGGVWTDVGGTVVSPTYPGANGITFETFTFTFNAVTGDGLRLYGVPGGAAKFVSIGELRAFGVTGTTTPTPPTPPVNRAPTANAGANQSVIAGTAVTLDGSASSDPDGNALTYLWTQIGTPAVTLTGATTARPTFTAPSVTASTVLTFSLVVSDATLPSVAATVSVTVAPVPVTPPPTGGTSVDVTASGTPVAFVPNPSGGGNHSLTVISDGVFPPVGSVGDAVQFDTYNGVPRTEDWVGYTFAAPQSFTKLVFQEGKQFGDGGWFTSLKVQVRQGGVWTNVAAAVTPAYPGANNITFETFTFTFSPTVGDGIRIDGAPGGGNSFISIAELRAYATGVNPGPAVNTAPVARAGSNQSVLEGTLVTLDGTGSTDAEGNALSYAWMQTGGTAVTLAGALTARPTFTAPAVTMTATTLTFSLVVQDASLPSAASTVTVTVNQVPAPPTGGASVDLTASGTAIAFVPNPSGGGNRNLAVISDGVFPAVGSRVDSTQFDTYNGVPRAEDWIGYQFPTQQTFGKVVFQEGNQFGDGGWFTTVKVQVRQNGVWIDVPGATATPAYAGANGITFQTFTFTFPAISGDGIRIDGALSGGSTFISVAELRVYTP